MDAYLAIVSRREVRDYAARALEPEIERQILEAGRLAGSAKNRQPWTFVVLRDDRLVERVAEKVFEPSNVRGAAFLVAIVIHGKAPGMDAGRAAQNMLLAAWAHGVGGSPNGISDRAAMGELLETGPDEEIVNLLSFGYPAKPRDPERRSAEEWIERANRKPFDEVVREL